MGAEVLLGLIGAPRSNLGSQSQSTLLAKAQRVQGLTC